MNYLSQLGKLFSLETLDTRLNPTTNPIKRQSIIKKLILLQDGQL